MSDSEQILAIRSDAKHTPGPWKVVDNSWEVSTVYDNAGNVVAECPIDGNVTEDTQAALELVKEARVRLIAAAPELLEALKAMILMSDRGPQPRKLDEALTWRQNDEKALAMAESAIAKATLPA